MASTIINGGEVNVRVLRRRLVKASDESIQPHVLAVSNLVLLPQTIQVSILPSLLNYYFPLASRIVTDLVSGIPEIHCYNQGVELVVGKILFPYAADVALSVQVVSFACGGFTVACGTNHVVVDGCALTRAFGDGDAVAGILAETRPIRVPPDVAFTPLDGELQVNVLTTDESFVGRLYYIEASDIARLRAWTASG
uniref:Uncharacterized protein n=1 Tax=Leersia perrieri TaxID=77586 RepID=A0A0D9WDC3_9ORYZ